MYAQAYFSFWVSSNNVYITASCLILTADFVHEENWKCWESPHIGSSKHAFTKDVCVCVCVWVRGGYTPQWQHDNGDHRMKLNWSFPTHPKLIKWKQSCMACKKLKMPDLTCKKFSKVLCYLNASQWEHDEDGLCVLVRLLSKWQHQGHNK